MTNPSAVPAGPRIRPWPIKLSYIVAAGAVVYLIGAIPIGAGGAGILRSGLAFVLVLVGARLFRGANEDPVPPRPWWRMTAGVPSGVALGLLLVVVVIISATGFATIALTRPGSQIASVLPALLVTTILAAILGFLYFYSSRRLALARRGETLARARNDG